MLEKTVRELLFADSEPAADHARSHLESLAVPIQVLKSEADEVTRLVIAGLPQATPFGRVEAWTLLVQLAGGACEPTPADPAVVSRVRGELLRVVPCAIETLDRGPDEAASNLLNDVFDVLDLIQDFLRETEVFEIWPAFERFAAKGTIQRSKVDLIVERYRDSDLH